MAWNSLTIQHSESDHAILFPRCFSFAWNEEQQIWNGDVPLQGKGSWITSLLNRTAQLKCQIKQVRGCDNFELVGVYASCDDFRRKNQFASLLGDMLYLSHPFS
jgi:hypothetical protein